MGIFIPVTSACLKVSLPYGDKIFQVVVAYPEEGEGGGLFYICALYQWVWLCKPVCAFLCYIINDCNSRELKYIAWLFLRLPHILSHPQNLSFYSFSNFFSLFIQQSLTFSNIKQRHFYLYISKFQFLIDWNLSLLVKTIKARFDKMIIHLLEFFHV